MITLGLLIAIACLIFGVLAFVYVIKG